MWKFWTITQGFYWHRCSAGAQPVTCTEDKGGNASPRFLAKRHSHKGVAAERRRRWRRKWRRQVILGCRRRIQFNHYQGKKKFEKQKKSWFLFFPQVNQSGSGVRNDSHLPQKLNSLERRVSEAKHYLTNKVDFVFFDFKWASVKYSP